MITALGELWQSADLTGNSQFLVVPSGGPEPYIYVVTNSSSTGAFKLLRSDDRGETFSAVATGTIGAASQFDPVVLYDGTYIHILGSKPNGSNQDLVKFRHAVAADDTVTPPVLSSVTILSGRKFHSAYDMVSLYDGHILIVTTVTNSAGYSMRAITVNTSDSISDTVTIGSVVSPRTGETYGGVSLVAVNGLSSSTVELYYTAHQKAVTFGSIPQEIRLRTFTTGGSWSSPTVLKSLISYYSDDCLTVLQVGDNRVVSSLYYSQIRGNLVSTLVLGSRVADEWTWVEHGSLSYNECYASPVLTVDGLNTICLSFLSGNLNRVAPKVLKVAVLNLGNLTFNLRNGSFNRLYFNWIRGTKTTVTEDAKWGLVGERAVYSGSTLSGYSPYYASELNLLPTVTLSPSSGTVRRGVRFTVDASGSSDPDYDQLGIEWSTDDTSGYVHLLDSATGEELQIPPDVPYSHPKVIDILVDKTIGPDAGTIVLTASAMDFTLSGTQIHLGSPTTTTASLTLAANSAPTIEWTANPFQVTRNSAITLAPVKDDAENDDLTYSWEQTAGPTLEILSATTLPYLVVKTHGVSTIGAQVQFTLTVSDGINSPVSSVLYVNIPAVVTYGLDDLHLSRAVFSNSHDLSAIVSRNNQDGVSEWLAPVEGAITTNFFKTRVVNNAITGHQRTVYVSPRSVAAFGVESDYEYYYRKVLLPNNDRGTIVDGLQNEVDDMYVLTDQYRLLRYTREMIGPDNTSDYWQEAIEIRPLLGSGYVKWFEASVPADGKRVLAFVTSGGLLLIQIDDTNFTLRENLLLTIEDGGLYGGNDILFVRFLNVESLHTGKVLIGSSKSANGQTEYFETVYDLSKGKTTKAWDRLGRANQEVYTGEIFDLDTVQYSGTLQAPSVSISTVGTTSANLSWQQIRPDLVDGYVVYVDVAGGIPGTVASVPPEIDVFKPLSAATVSYGTNITFRFSARGADYLHLQTTYINGEVESQQIPVSATSFGVVAKQTATYELIATNSWGNSFKTFTITVNETTPLISSLVATPDTVTVGEPVTLTWVIVGADSITIDNGVGYANPELGFRTIYPTVSGAYTLYATNPYGTETETINITVN